MGPFSRPIIPDEIREGKGMAQLRFSLRQLLIAVAVLAPLFLLARFATRDRTLAIGLTTLGVAAVVLLVANLLVYGFLLGVGRLCGFELSPATPREDPNTQLPGGPTGR